MRRLVIIVIFVFAGCQSPKKDCDFTFYKWNIRESYYLKFNSTDTLYYINTYPFEEQTSFTILKNEEKEEIQNVLDSISFPKGKITFDSNVDDGVTYAFNLKKDNKTRKLKIHGHHNGPKQFWNFGERLDKIKAEHKFIQTNKRFDLSEIDSMVISKVKFVEK